jgi:hypothetical protein
VNSVKVIYAKNLKDGDDRRIDDAPISVLAIRLKPETTFVDVLEYCKDF